VGAVEAEGQAHDPIEVGIVALAEAEVGGLRERKEAARLDGEGVQGGRCTPR
jgi:hypothetical protein